MDSVHLAPRIQLAHHRLADDAIEWGALNALSRRFGLELLPHVVWTVSGQRVEVEGADPAGKVLVQVVANRGQLKSFHRNKILADMLKLLWIRQSGFQASRIVVCVNDTLARAFNPSGWAAAAAREMNVTVLALVGPDQLVDIHVPDDPVGGVTVDAVD